MTTKITVTLNDALNKRKILLKRIKKSIKDLESGVKVVDSVTTFVDGVDIDKWKSRVNSKIASFDRLIQEYEAYNIAIMKANAISTVKVSPMFKLGTDSEPGEYEVIPFAAAISRKKFLEDIQESFKNILEGLNSEASTYRKRVRYNEDYIAKIIEMEFKGSNASNTVKSNRTNTLRELYKIEVLDPGSLLTNLPDVIDFIDSYISEIDHALSKETQKTKIDIEF